MVSEPSLPAARFAAAILLSRYGITQPEEIQLEDMAWDMGIRVKIASLSGAEAWLLRDGSKGIVRLSNRIKEEGRFRFALAHELGHWECHLRQCQAWICTSQDIHSYLGSAAEIEANTFASHLLMPKSMLAPRLQGQALTINLLCQIAQEFNTTLTATAVRVIEEMDEDCCVVFSQRNLVRWWRRSPKSNLGLPSHFAISDESRAFGCTREPGRTQGPTKVDSQIWRCHRHIEVWEESVLLGDYGTVLTLLSFA